MTTEGGALTAPRPDDLWRLFTPKLVTVLREGYGAAHLRRDAMAGATVAVVALPLSMAIAIASGAPPAMGLTTAIIGGFLVSALGGSRHQIGGPAGAFIVLVSATIMRHGLDGLVLATMLSGVLLALAGALRLGALAKLIPYPVTIGFTAGIAAIIFASQLSSLLGLTLSGPEPGPLAEKLPALYAALPSVTPAALALALGVVLVILVLRRLRPTWPGMLAAVALASAVAYLGQLPVETIGSRFGAMPSALPLPGLPEISLEKVLAVAPDAAAFALLGAIESLLSAVVADGMTGRRHRADAELVAQGAANIASGLFGGFCVTGAIARTATNIRAGAHGPVSGMIHALALLGFLLIAAPLAAFIPLAALAGVLAIVAWDMVEKPAIAALLRGPFSDAAVFATTLLLTLFRDLSEAIVVGSAFGALVFIRRMSRATAFESAAPLVREDAPDEARPAVPTPPAGVQVYRVSGVLFFGSAPSVDKLFDRIGAAHRALVLDLSETPFVDVSGAYALSELTRRIVRHGGAMAFVGAAPDVAAALRGQAEIAAHARFFPSLGDAFSALEEGAASGA